MHIIAVISTASQAPLLETHIRSEALKFMNVLGGPKRMLSGDIYMCDKSWKGLIVFNKFQFFNLSKY